MDPRNPQDGHNSSSASNSTPSQPSHSAPTQPAQSQYGGQYSTPPPQQQYPQQGQQPPYQQPPQPQYQQQYQPYPPPPKKGGSGLVWGLLGLLVATLVGGGVLIYILLQPGNRTTTGTSTGNTQITPVAGQTPDVRPTTGGGSTTGNSDDNASLLKTAAGNMREFNAYTFDADITASGQDVLMRTDLENLKSSNKAAKMSIEAQGQSVQVIVIGDQVWASVDGGATFTDASANGAQMTSSIDQFAKMWSEFKDSDVDQAKGQLKDGSPATESIDGVSTKHMIGDIQSLSALGGATSGGAMQGTIELWVGTDSNAYVHRMRIDATSDGQPVKGTINWSNFNDTFNIQAP